VELLLLPQSCADRSAGRGRVSWSDVLDLLCERIGLLDAVVFSGGEPTLQRALVPAMRTVRTLGFAVGLHTGGAYPGLLAQALPEVDWVGSTSRRVPTTTTSSREAEQRVDGLALLALVLGNRELRAGTDHPLELEVRTTVHPAAFDDARLRALGCRLAEAGVDHWAVQRFRAAGTRSPLPRVERHPSLSATFRASGSRASCAERDSALAALAHAHVVTIGVPSKPKISRRRRWMNRR
jgi:pyruvate formate lyase activating enzyme